MLVAAKHGARSLTYIEDTHVHELCSLVDDHRVHGMAGMYLDRDGGEMRGSSPCDRGWDTKEGRVVFVQAGHSRTCPAILFPSLVQSDLSLLDDLHSGGWAPCDFVDLGSPKFERTEVDRPGFPPQPRTTKSLSSA